MGRYSPTVLPHYDYPDMGKELAGAIGTYMALKGQGEQAALAKRNADFDFYRMGGRTGTAPVEEPTTVRIPGASTIPTDYQFPTRLGDALGGSFVERQPLPADATPFDEKPRGTGLDLAGALGGINFDRSPALPTPTGFNGNASAVPAMQASTTPGAFNPMTGTFGAPRVPMPNAQTVTLNNSQPRFQQIDAGHYLDTYETPDAQAERRQMAQLDARQRFAETVAEGERNRKRNAYLAAGMDPSLADAAVENPGLADNILFPAAGRGRQVVQAEDGVYLVDTQTGQAQRIIDQSGQAIRPRPPASLTAGPSWQTVQTEDGFVQVNPKTGETRAVSAPGSAPTGQQLQPRDSGTIRQKVASNQTRIRTIDEAITKLQAYPNAVGLSRGIPLIGDALNQRNDPKGVDARAALADIGSLTLHDRSGAAVTAAEMPRLAPFIPRASDTYDAALTKLRRMRQLIEEETAALEKGGSASGGDPARGFEFGAPARPTAPQYRSTNPFAPQR